MFIGRGHACVSDLARGEGMKDRKRIAHATTCGTTTAGTRAPGAAGTRSRHPTRRGVVRILVDPGAKAGWAELAGHYSYTVNRVIFVTLQTFCATALVPNQIFVL